MKRKVGWLFLSFLMALSLVLASCAPAEEEEEEVVVIEEEEEVVTEEEEEVVTEEEEEVVTEEEGAPQYGGTMTYVFRRPPQGFDEHLFSGAPTMNLTNEYLMGGNRKKGPGPNGDGATDYYLSWIPFPEYYDGQLAESYTLEPGKVTFKIRQEVYWQNKPPVNGREFDAYDAEFALSRSFFEERLYTYYPPGIGPDRIEATDKWTLECDIPIATTGLIFLELGGWCKILPPEPVEEYGDMMNWKNANGTGPYMLTDYVPMSSATFTRNPNYWMYDEFNPENQLPYIDTIKALVIQDMSTKLAALRTGKVDTLREILQEDADSLLATNPELESYGGYVQTGGYLYMRLDKPELPFADIRVRQAMAIAIDREAIVNDLYGGNASAYCYPAHPSPTFDVIRIPFEDLPEAVQELYDFNPTKAKALLAAAGYENGFKTKCNILMENIDIMSVIQANLLDVGIDMELIVMEDGAFSAMQSARAHEEMLYWTRSICVPWEMAEYKVGDPRNGSYVDDPFLTEARLKIMESFVVDMPSVYPYWKENVAAYLLEKAYHFTPPVAMNYTFWQPWLKDYYGEYSYGYYNVYDNFKWLWIDQDLKKSMGH